jgi:GNAT superfamily N-acetyltransferase
LRVVTTLTIRRALPAEAALLTALALRSKAHWGYDEAFLRLVMPALILPADAIAEGAVYAAERAGVLVGYYALMEEGGAPTLRDLWVEPSAIGTGVGALLWRHMLGVASAAGFRAVRLESDPYAEGFYTRMGARRIGTVTSPVTGRLLPLMEVAIPANDARTI